VAQEISDLSAELASIGAREVGFPVPHGRGDEVHHGSPMPDPRGEPKARNLVDPLCRIRHKRSDPEPETMPTKLPRPRDFR
jgi:error-prone DNA polymerase